MGIHGESPPPHPFALLRAPCMAVIKFYFFTFAVYLACRPTCQWFKDGAKLSERSHQINNKERTLTIKSASPDDNGLYYCCAKNAAGHVCSSSNFTLNIIGVCVCLCANFTVGASLRTVSRPNVIYSISSPSVKCIMSTL